MTDSSRYSRPHGRQEATNNPGSCATNHASAANAGASGAAPTGSAAAAGRGAQGRHWAPSEHRTEEAAREVKLEDVREAYYGYSGLASKSSRALAFAGIAIVWVFTQRGDGAHSVPPELIVPLSFFALSLALDWLHYLSSGVIWWLYNHKREKLEDRFDAGGVAADDPKRDVELPKHINTPGVTLWLLKSLALAPGYGMLLVFLVRQWT